MLCVPKLKFSLPSFSSGGYSIIFDFVFEVRFLKSKFACHIVSVNWITEVFASDCGFGPQNTSSTLES